MPIIGADGLPIIGSRSPRDTFVEEKNSLGEEDHDWVLIVEYGITNEQAPRVIESRDSGVPANPPIRFEAWNMGQVLGPLCRRCQEPYEVVNETPCPGISFEAYIASLDPETREKVLAALQRQANLSEEERAEEARIAEEGYDTATGGGFDGIHVPDVPVAGAHSAVEGYDYTLDDGTIVHQPAIEGLT